MLVYIPFIYFTIWLIIHFSNPKMRFGAGAMSLLWIDISAFFAILLDTRNIYGDWGCNDYALSLSGVCLYCALWTIVLYPITRLDNKEWKFQVTKQRLFSIMCVVLIICTGIYIMAIGATNIVERLSMARHEAYSDSTDSSIIYQSKGQFLLWIPLVVSRSWPLLLLCWFISFCVAPQRNWIKIGLLISSVFMMISGYADGGRAQLIWWCITFLIYFFLFLPHMKPRQRIIGFILIIFIGSLAVIGTLSITLSRFDSSAQGYALNSIIGYAGQPLNNFCAILPYADTFHIYLDRIFPLTNLFLNHQTYNLHDYYDFLSQHYPLQMNVFFTIFGSLLIDVGWGGLLIYLILCIILFYSTIYSKKYILDMSQSSILAVYICIPVRGFFDYPFFGHISTLYILLSIGIFFIFKLKINYGNKKIL